MTAEELILQWNSEYGPNPWPVNKYVDSHTYANCCQYVFDRLRIHGYSDVVSIRVGPNGGLMFKNVELLLRDSI